MSEPVTGPTAGPDDASARDGELSRDLGLFSVTFIGIGAMIGAGVFALTGFAAGLAGPALLLAFALNAMVATLTALAYAELGSSYPRSGGAYNWVAGSMSGGHCCASSPPVLGAERAARHATPPRDSPGAMA